MQAGVLWPPKFVTVLKELSRGTSKKAIPGLRWFQGTILFQTPLLRQIRAALSSAPCWKPQRSGTLHRVGVQSPFIPFRIISADENQV